MCDSGGDMEGGKHRLTNISNTKWKKNDDRGQTWIKSKSNEKHTRAHTHTLSIYIHIYICTLSADPTHLVHLSRSLSSPALPNQPVHMKIVGLIKVQRGSCPRVRQRADRRGALQRCQSRMARASGDKMKRKWKKTERRKKRRWGGEDLCEHSTQVFRRARIHSR